MSLAAPVNAPVNPVEVTDVRPVIVVAVAPSATLVDPIVIELFTKLEFGILVKPAPLPANPVALKIPLLGTKCNAVLDVCNATLPGMPTGGDGQEDPGTPFDGGITLLIAAGAGISAIGLNKAKKNKPE